MGTPESSTRNGRKPSSDSGGGLGSCSSDMAPHRDSCHPRIRTARFNSRSSSSCSRHLGSSFAVSRQSVSQEGRIRVLNRGLGVLLEAAQDAEWVLALERRIAVTQITDRMDDWTKKVWQARQYGYSWKEISTWLGITEHKAKMKFQYGLEKTRASLLRSLKVTWVKKSD